jgi:hypothetical protein
LPRTALVSDTADRILIGAVALFVGLWIYLTGYYKIIGDYLWIKAAQPVLKNIWKEYRSRTFESDLLDPGKTGKRAKRKTKR